jgi:hypothetical protein
MPWLCVDWSDGTDRSLIMDGKSLVIGALLIGVVVLGYMVWDSRENTVVKLPGVEIKKN